jgi:hypothetical protein
MQKVQSVTGHFALMDRDDKPVCDYLGDHLAPTSQLAG